MENKVVVTCALTGVLTDPKKFNVPVTPEQMADAAKQAYDQGATIIHAHFRSQQPGMGAFPTWDLEPVGKIIAAIRDRVPNMIINMSTGVMGKDISGPVACLEKFKPEMAACNAGSLNYLKIRKDGEWAWPPILFDNPVEKVKSFADVMTANNIIPEFECFDTGIVRSVGMFKANGMFKGDPHLSFVMGVDSGMPARFRSSAHPERRTAPERALAGHSHRFGREKLWELHKTCIELGGNVRTGLEDTLYLPMETGLMTMKSGEALVKIIREVGKEPASPSETRRILGIR